MIGSYDLENDLKVIHNRSAVLSPLIPKTYFAEVTVLLKGEH